MSGFMSRWFGGGSEKSEAAPSPTMAELLAQEGVQSRQAIVVPGGGIGKTTAAEMAKELVVHPGLEALEPQKQNIYDRFAGSLDWSKVTIEAGQGDHHRQDPSRVSNERQAYLNVLSKEHAGSGLQSGGRGMER